MDSAPPATPSNANRFQDFFEDIRYVTLKNSLYNYLLRKRAVEKSFAGENPGLILEVGSGISPVMTKSERIVYSELSFTALQTLRRTHPKGWFVVADGTRLPFKTECFTHTVSSEVLEHLEDDRAALRELARVMKPSGRLVVTFPHGRFYFGNDDRFVRHFRRYDLSDMEERLKEAGLKPVWIEKVLGPLEKITCSFLVFCFSKMRVRTTRDSAGSSSLLSVLVPFLKWANRLYMVLVWADARVMPRFLSTVLLMKAEKPSGTP